MKDKTNDSQQRLIRMSEVRRLTGLSKTDVYRFIGNGTFPRQIKIGTRAVAWVEEEVQEWIKKTIQAARKES